MNEDYLKEVDKSFEEYPTPVGKVVFSFLGLFGLFMLYFWLWSIFLGK